MENIEKILLVYYEKGLSLLSIKWNSTVESFYAFDFVMLTKIGFVLLLGYFLAKILSKYIPKTIQFIGQRINLSIDNDLILAIRSFIFKLILFSFVLIAVNIMDLPKTIDFIANAIVKSILFISFIAFALNIVKIILNKMAFAPEKENDKESVKVVQESTLPLFENTALIFFSLGGLYQVFSIWNVDMTALLAGAGIGAMAVGMAAKDTLSDIIAGILILTDAPYRVGDVVYVRNNLKGRVVAIGLRNTRLVTKNNVEVIVPNTIMGTSQIINESSAKDSGIRIQLDISVAVGEDVGRVKELLVASTKNTKRIAQDKEIKALMVSFEQYMLRFRIQCWINNPEDKGSAKGELMESIYITFRHEGIDITMTREQSITMSHAELPPQEIRITQFPETQQTVHVKEFPDTKQEVNITEFPDTKQEQFIKEIPNIFGTAKAKKLTKVSKNPKIKKISEENNDEK